jgi:hypothetical protein
MVDNEVDTSGRISDRGSWLHRLYNNGPKLHEIIQEVFVAILVARFCQIVLGHDVVVGMISSPCKLLPLLGDSGFFLALPMG